MAGDSLGGTRTLSLAANTPENKKIRYGLAGGCGCIAVVLLILGVLGTLGAKFKLFTHAPGLAFFALLMAFVVGLPYAAMIAWVDRNEREPFYLLAAAFIWGGAFSIFVSSVVNTSVARAVIEAGGDAAAAQFAMASLSAPFIEEATKCLAVLAIFIIAPKHFDNVLDGIIYGAMAGMGFAIAENFDYYIKAAGAAIQQGESGYKAILLMTWLRGVLGGIGSHAAYTAFAGAGFGLFRVLRKGVMRWFVPVLGLGVAMFLHFVWNTFNPRIMEAMGARTLTDAAVFGMPTAVLFLQIPFVLVIAVAIYFSLRHEAQIIREYLKSESPRVVAPEEMQNLLPARRRTFISLKLLATFQFGDWWTFRRRHARLVKLAFEKWHMDKEHEIGDEETAHYHAERVMGLRHELSGAPPLTSYG